MRLYFIQLVLASAAAFGQSFSNDAVEEKDLRPWVAKELTEYAGVYHFGISEGESDLLLIVSGTKVYGQIRSGHFSTDGRMWIRKYENIRNIRIEDHKFFSEKADGEFIYYPDAQEEVSGLRINNPWSASFSQYEYEIGARVASVETYFPGDYIQASMQLLTAADLRKLTKGELGLMRNEIFARYGLLFKRGGETDVYFRQKDWYFPQHDNVDNFLTGLEVLNIRLIKQLEGR